MAPNLDLQLLGGFRIQLGETALPAIEHPRLQALLAYLALHGDVPHSRQQLAFLLWPDSTEGQARSNLRTLVSRLRAALPNADSFLTIGAQTVQWRPGAPWVLDVAQFEQALAQADQANRAGDLVGAPAALAQAVELYRGDLLPGCYDDWILPERERLRQILLAALERLLLLLEQRRDYPPAIRAAQRLLRHDPLHEVTYQHLMRLHARSGDRASALRAYQTCAAVLRRELDVDPSPATTAAYKRLADAVEHAEAVAESPPPADRPPQLPTPLTSLIGRTRERAEVARLLATTRLLTLTGAGGSGKTRLALAVAADVMTNEPEGVALVELAALADPSLAPQAVASALGLREEGQRPMTTTLAEALRSREILLVLDNCEHLIDACAHLAQMLLNDCPRLRILATSREPLGVAGETTWLVPSLALPDPRLLALSGMELVNGLKQVEAIQLFVERATATLPTFTLIPDNAAAIAQICRRLDGIPLAIELAAARVKLLSVAQLAARLDDCFQVLAGGSRTTLPRQQTLRAAIDWSYQLLTAEERALFQRLAVFAGDWNLEAAEAIASAWSLDYRDRSKSFHEQTTLNSQFSILNVLARLVDKSLVAVVDTSGGEARYRLLETVRQYGHEKLRESGEEPEIQRRHAHFYLALAEQAELGLRGSDARRWSDQLMAEYDNLRLALAWSLSSAGDVALGLRLAAALEWFWNLRGLSGEGRGWIKNLLARSGPADDARVRAKALSSACFMAYLLSDYPAAQARGRESVALFRETDDQHGLAYALWHLGQAIFGTLSQPHPEPARPLFEESVALFRDVGDAWGLGEALVWLTTSAFYQGDDAMVRAAGEESLAAFRAVGEVAQAAVPLHMLAWVAFREGDQATARAHSEVCLAIMRENADKPGIAIMLGTIGKLVCIQGDYPAARAAFDERLALWRAIGNNGELAHTLIWLGIVDCRLGDHRQAATHLTAGLALLREQDDQQGLALCLAGLAEAACGTRSLDWAAQLFGAAQSLLDTIGALPNLMDRNEYDQIVDIIRAHLDETAWAAWRAQPLQQALAEAVGVAEGLRARAVAAL
jgi:predicted ATPase/DNA-binding SARP family transcriptional activator